jgi:hypothetical protein
MRTDAGCADGMQMVQFADSEAGQRGRQENAPLVDDERSISVQPPPSEGLARRVVLR